MTETQPVTQHIDRSSTPTERALAPDLGRGLMLALIAIANVMIYLIDRPYGYRQHIVEDGAANHVVSTLVVTLVDGRAFPLFAFLFGYGIVQLAGRQRAKGTADAEVRRILRRRHLALIVIGAVHAVLLFPGDILGWYGVVGLLVVALLGRGDRALLTLGALWLLPASIVVGLIYSRPAPGDDRGHFWSFEVADPTLTLGLRALEWVMSPFGLLPVVTAALVGVVAARHRILEEPRAHRRLLRRVATGGIALAVAGGLPSGLVVGSYLSTPDGTVAWLLAFVHSLTGVAGGLGLAAGFGLVAARSSQGRRRALIDALAATGRRSMSAYLFQSVVFVALLTLPLGGLGAELGTATAAGLALAVWAVSVLVAALMDRRSVRGPAEVVLRRWSYRPARVEPRSGRKGH